MCGSYQAVPWYAKVDTISFQTKQKNIFLSALVAEIFVMERDNRVSIRALLDAGKTPTEISHQLGVSRPAIYAVLRSNSIERKAGSGGKAKFDPEEFKTAAMVSPLKSMRSHARDLGV